MGKVIVPQVVLKNNDDYRDFQRGRILESAVRSQTLEMIADSGARAIGLPLSIIKALGLPTARTVTVTLSNGQKEQRLLYGELRLQIEDRESVFECIDKPEDAPCLIGQVVLEVLDYVVDCGGQRLIPNPAAPPGMMLYEDYHEEG